MQIEFGAGEICLSGGRPLVLRDAAGWSVHCVGGRLWITVAGEAADNWLQAGDSYRIPRSGLTLIEGFDEARLTLAPAIDSGRLRRTGPAAAVRGFRA